MGSSRKLWNSNKLGEYTTSGIEGSHPLTNPQNENKYMAVLHSDHSWSLLQTK